MEDLKALTDCAECTWDYIDRLRMSLAYTCKERDEARKELHEAKSELLKYREAEQAGRLVVLPCKVGDDVWFVRKFGKGQCIKRAKVSCINIDFRGEVFVSARRISGGYIGKTVFMTREEAEAALAQEGGTNEDSGGL